MHNNRYDNSQENNTGNDIFYECDHELIDILDKAKYFDVLTVDQRSQKREFIDANDEALAASMSGF